VLKNINPNTLIGILFNEPSIEYVVADVEDTHHNEAKLRKKPHNAAITFMRKKFLFIISVSNNTASSLRNIQSGNNKNNDNKLL
jgi:hypothetical protein